jgi:hypothetical protein
LAKGDCIMPTLKEHLEEAYKLLEKGECKGAYARDAEGRTVYIKGQEASCFCSAGAVMRVTELSELTVHDSPIVRHLDNTAKRLCGRNSIAWANDNLTYEEVKKIWKEAIASC